MTRVLFAAPTYDYKFSAEYVASMMQTTIHLIKRGHEVEARFIGGLCFIDLARCGLATYFLQTKADCLFFIDADVGWDWQAVERFINYDKGVVAGLVPKKWDDNPYHDNGLTGVVEGGLLQAIEAPTAFMCIKREVFERLDREYPEYKDYMTLKNGPAYFQTGYMVDKEKKLIDGVFRGEDIFFCLQWQKLGEFVWIDPNVTFTHRGSKAWSGNYMQHGVEKGKFTVAERST
jgi:hypothetical protein